MMALTIEDIVIAMVFLLVSVNCKVYFNASDSTLIRPPRQTVACRNYDFKCFSGTQCISDNMVCDGKEDCSDGSDELDCARLQCPGYAFRCSYGACINSNFECDGKKDCKDNSDETSPKCSRGPAKKKCQDFQFRCETGECISEDFVCDGKADCSDRSDETQNICSSLHCPEYNFRCSYGACVNSEAKCNGKIDCVDGSDESPAACNTTPAVTPIIDVTPSVTDAAVGEGCVLPSYLHNGKYSVFGSSVTPLAGSTISRGSVIQISCNERYRTVPNGDFIICRGTEWSSAFPKCVITCTSIKETESQYANCTYNNAPVSCDEPVQGTRAKFVCKDLYEDLNSVQNPSRRCNDDGTWDNQFPNCIPKCGRKSVDAQALIVGGKKAKKGDYPWQAAIYDTSKNNMNICGGTIISVRTVVSAAHCFTRSNRGNALNPTSQYKVGAGKYYIRYKDPRDALAQYSDVKRIMVPGRYTGRTNQYSFDIAVVILQEQLQLSIVVQPICVDWNNVLETEQLRPNSFGVVTGWGLTSSGGKQSEELKELSVPYVSDGECLQNLRDDFKPYFTLDKMCSGYLQNGSSACEGDSGGGLVFPSREQRYYIRGVVSVAPKGPFESCDADEYTLYTKVSQHIDFISEADSLAKSL